MQALDLLGHKSYIVGGAVRDQLLGKKPKDIDIVTFALPKQVEKMAQDNHWGTKAVGRRFGIVIVTINKESFEVATTRREWHGNDAHRPEGVAFCNSIEEDLSRRDFTINAMAIDINDNLIDPFGGQQDLKNKVIRTVGNPKERFNEDTLRMFRAGRLASQLGFDIDDEIKEATSQVSLRNLSVESVRDELEKTLISDYPEKGLSYFMETGLLEKNCISRKDKKEHSVSILPELKHLNGLEQNPRYHRYDVWGHTLEVVKNSPPMLSIRWAALFHDVGKGLPEIRCINNKNEVSDPGHEKKSTEIARNALSRLKVCSNIKKKAVWLVNNHMKVPFPDNTPKWLKKQSVVFKNKQQLAEGTNQLIELHKADILAGKTNSSLEDLHETLRSLNKSLQMPYYRNELNISGKDVAPVLGEGPQVGRFLSNLLERIQSGQLKNTKEELSSALNKKALRQKREQISASLTSNIL